MVAGVILAAGASTRMGRPKQLLDWNGMPLLRHVALQTLAASLDAVYVVLGAYAAEVAAALQGLPLRLVRNERYAEGQSTSLRAGVAALPPQTDAAVILLGDQPFVTSALIATLVEAARSSDTLIIAPQVAGRRANPVVFKAALFPQLLQIEGDQGARELIAAHRQHMLLVPRDDAAIEADLDTPEDYQRLRPR